MRVTAVIMLALLATTTLAVQSKMRTAATAKKIDAIKAQGGWASIVLDMAEIHARNSHPLDELKEALRNVIEDLTKKRQQADEDFAARTEQHHTTVQTLQNQINHAIEDQTRSNDNLNENLYPTQESLNRSVADSEKVIEELTAENAQLKKKREEDNNAFNTKMTDADEGIKIMEECLTEVKTLLEGGAVGFAQLQSKKETFTRAEKALKKMNSKEFSIAVALSQVASNSKEIDSAKVQKILDLFHENINNLTATKARWAAEEKTAVDNYNTKITNNENTITKNRNNISDCEARLKIVAEEIVATQDFIARRKADQAKFEKELDMENESYEQAKLDYAELCAQLTKERTACEEALKVLEGANFSDVIESRLNDGNHTGSDWDQSRDNVDLAPAH